MKLRNTVLGAVALGMTALTSTASMAADIPCSTAKLIVPWAPGGGTHIIFSIFEEEMNKMDGPKIQVVTISGQGGNKGAKEALKAKADGCTLFAIHQSAIVSYLAGRVDFTWDAFDMVAQVTSTPEVVGAAADVPWSDFNAMIADAKANPNTIPLGATLGSTSQFMWLLIEELNPGAKFKYIPFDGTAQRVTALLSGTIKLGTVNIPTAEKNVGQGTLKALAVAAPERLPQFPDVPTLKELGTDMTYSLDRGIVAPKGTPKDVIEMWSKRIKAAAESPDLLAKLKAKGTPVNWVGPEGYAEWFQKEYSAHEKVAIKIGMFKK
ncbi:MAG: Bug family tripartite tricarboxylate transporter substrate binding protein [Rhizobiaceae bacterium]